MAKTREAHSFRPRVRQGPSSPTAGPSLAAVDSSTADITAASSSAAAVGAGPSVPAVSPTSAPAAIVPVGDAEGSSSVAPAQRRYHT